VLPIPSFTGGFLPANRQVNNEGFTTNWLVTFLNRNFPQQWNDRQFNTHEAKLGVELLIPVDHYQKSMRSVKYAILFIALNFIIFIFIKIKSKARIHPFQYSLVAFALLIFYALLAGSIGLFVILAIIMRASKQIKWYAE
jgi:inner membrane protein